MSNADPTLLYHTELITHVIYLVKIMSPLIVVIIGLLVWAWKKSEQTQQKFEEAFTKHVQENDRLHDALFTQLRDSDAKLHRLLGEHDSIKNHFK